MELSRRAAFMVSFAILLAAPLLALAAPQVEAAPAKPQCSITRPYDNATVSGKLRITGTADMASDPIIKVQLRIDGGSLLIANGTDSWHFDIDTTILQNGRHTVEAKAFDGTSYSDPASVTFSVQNSKAPAPVDQPFPFVVVIVLVLVAGVAVAAWRMMRYRDPPPPQ